MNSPRSIRTGQSRQRQSGAVLYIALIMLILLALIGIVGMQVAGMQERMSANYRAVNVAFQNAEGIAGTAECAIEDLVNRTSTTGCTAITPSQLCDDGFDALAWTEAQDATVASAINARLIGPCISGNSNLAMGAPVNEDPNPIYQITAFATDREGADTVATSASAVDTIFRP